MVNAAEMLSWQRTCIQCRVELKNEYSNTSAFPYVLMASIGTNVPALYSEWTLSRVHIDTAGL